MALKNIGGKIVTYLHTYTRLHALQRPAVAQATTQTHFHALARVHMNALAHLPLSALTAGRLLGLGRRAPGPLWGGGAVEGCSDLGLGL